MATATHIAPRHATPECAPGRAGCVEAWQTHLPVRTGQPLRRQPEQEASLLRSAHPHPSGLRWCAQPQPAAPTTWPRPGRAEGRTRNRCQHRRWTTCHLHPDDHLHPMTLRCQQTAARSLRLFCPQHRRLALWHHPQQPRDADPHPSAQ